jgi:hypothetical protein
MHTVVQQGRSINGAVTFSSWLFATAHWPGMCFMASRTKHSNRHGASLEAPPQPPFVSELMTKKYVSVVYGWSIVDFRPLVLVIWLIPDPLRQTIEGYCIWKSILIDQLGRIDPNRIEMAVKQINKGWQNLFSSTYPGLANGLYLYPLCRNWRHRVLLLMLLLLPLYTLCLWQQYEPLVALMDVAQYTRQRIVRWFLDFANFKWVSLRVETTL